ncbi:hypothetical protein KY284_036164 [Solanum tuberosum]|nr:hypothetical protein KY284_036164 [Solanum tuberosum]
MKEKNEERRTKRRGWRHGGWPSRAIAREDKSLQADMREFGKEHKFKKMKMNRTRWPEVAAAGSPSPHRSEWLFGAVASLDAAIVAGNREEEGRVGFARENRETRGRKGSPDPLFMAADRSSLAGAATLGGGGKRWRRGGYRVVRLLNFSRGRGENEKLG